MNYPTESGYYWYKERKEPWLIVLVTYDQYVEKYPQITINWMNTEDSERFYPYTEASFMDSIQDYKENFEEVYKERFNELVPLFFKHLGGKWGPAIPQYIPKV